MHQIVCTVPSNFAKNSHKPIDVVIKQLGIPAVYTFTIALAKLQKRASLLFGAIAIGMVEWRAFTTNFHEIKLSLGNFHAAFYWAQTLSVG